jgi:glycosyltransferase involved in cell wall biosynthesis
MRLSVIVCTRNRARLIGPCLGSIERALSAAAPVEAQIVVVDNGSTDDTAATVAAWAAQASFPVKLEYEPRPGIAGAHNCGFRAATGDLLVCTDDDCRLDANYIRNLLAHDAQDDALVLRGGRVELGDATDLPLTIKADLQPQHWSRVLRSARRENLGNCFHGCNVSMRRALLDRVGLYDDAHFSTGAEDTDFIFRCYVAGIAIEYAPDLVVYHYHGRKTPAEGYSLFRNYMIHMGALYAKYLFKDPDLCRQIFWDVRNSVKELMTGHNTFIPAIGFSHRDRLRYNALGALRYWCGRRI